MMVMLKMILIVSQLPALPTDLFKSVAKFLKKQLEDSFEPQTYKNFKVLKEKTGDAWVHFDFNATYELDYIQVYSVKRQFLSESKWKLTFKFVWSEGPVADLNIKLYKFGENTFSSYTLDHDRQERLLFKNYFKFTFYNISDLFEPVFFRIDCDVTNIIKSKTRTQTFG